MERRGTVQALALHPVVLVQLPPEADAKKDQAFKKLESLLEENGKL